MKSLAVTSPSVSVAILLHALFAGPRTLAIGADHLRGHADPAGEVAAHRLGAVLGVSSH
jgi:hypothetical protein